MVGRVTGGGQQARATGQEGEEGPERSKSGFSAGLLTSRCSSSPPISVHRRFAVDLPLPPLLGFQPFDFLLSLLPPILLQRDLRVHHLISTTTLVPALVTGTARLSNTRFSGKSASILSSRFRGSPALALVASTIFSASSNHLE